MPAVTEWGSFKLAIGNWQLTTETRSAHCVESRIAAMISNELLQILVCPACKKPLVLKENGESLKCGHCHRVYPIRDDIPVLLVDEAVTEPS